ncbi:MAG TPA: aspartyl protease family protein [Rhizomicrobium sp.]|nr:aspartyl protease family protein [Rhizomicrobium sp.]
MRIEPGRTALAVLFLATALSGAAWAQDCKPLAIITTVDMVPSDDRREEFVPVTIAGVPKLMLLDTGGGTVITGDVADELKLARRQGNFELYSVSATHSSEFVTAPLQIGKLTAPDLPFVIAPGTNPFGTDTRIAGIIGPDTLHAYDVDIDFGTQKLTILSQDHCEGKVIYWPATAVAVVPMRVLGTPGRIGSGATFPSYHMLIQVALDGHPITAMVDTGAYNTTLTVPAAQSDMGLTLGSPDTPTTGMLPDRVGAYTYKHTFKTLDFEGITVANPHVDIIPDTLHAKFENTPELGSRLGDPGKGEASEDMLLGMDVLRHFHIYIAYKEQKLYITPADAPATQPPPAAH